MRISETAGIELIQTLPRHLYSLSLFRLLVRLIVSFVLVRSRHCACRGVVVVCVEEARGRECVTGRVKVLVWLEWKKYLDFLDLLSFGHLFRDCFRGFIFT